MIRLLTAAAVAMATPGWTSLRAFALTCTGKQVAYQETSKVQQTIPWQETFRIDLDRASFCSAACVRRAAIVSVGAEGIVLENSQGRFDSSLKRFHASGGAIEMRMIAAASKTDRFHVETAGTCTVGPIPVAK
jgi:hypothetical protein